MIQRTVTLLLLAAALWIAAAQEMVNPCTVQIANPQSGDRVQAEANISGLARNIPAGAHVWLFAHRRGLGLWWPQGGGAAQIRDGRWQVYVTFGQTRDSGSDFEITAAVLSDAGNADMNNWVKRAEDTGQYPGVRLPASLQGCVSNAVVVTRD